MRSSAEIWRSINELEDDKLKLESIRHLLSEIGESLLNYSKDLTEISNLLFEGYNEDEQRIDGKVSEYSEEYYFYANEILSLAESIAIEISQLTNEISSERVEYSKAVARERAAAEEKLSEKRITEIGYSIR